MSSRLEAESGCELRVARSLVLLLAACLLSFSLLLEVEQYPLPVFLKQWPWRPPWPWLKSVRR